MMQIEKIKCSFSKIPFKSILSLELLITQLKEIRKSKAHPMSESARSILSEINKFPFLNEPIEDRSLLSEHQELINKLMAFVFNPMKDKLDVAAAVPPFTPETFYTTSLFNDTIIGDQRKLELAKDMDDDKMLIAVIYQAYLVILKKFYGLDIYVDIPFVFKLTDEKDNTLKYFKVRGIEITSVL